MYIMSNYSSLIYDVMLIPIYCTFPSSVNKDLVCAHYVAITNFFGLQFECILG